MGHIRLKRLPATRKWRQVMVMLAGGAAVEDVAAASAEAAENALKAARRDPVLAQAVWLLTQLPLAARARDFGEAAWKLGIHLGSQSSLIDVVAAFSDAVDHAASRAAGRTDLGEMARLAAAESLAAAAGAGIPSLFGESPEDVRLALGKLAAPDRFARLARDFFARLTKRHLDYYLSQTLSNHVGPGQRLATAADHSAFNGALDLHCREASRIVEEFAGGWFSKTTYQGGITPQKARDFAFVALGKISAELRKRETDDA
jgi:hypothetical protein